MFAAIRSCWALLIGIALIMLGNGLQGTLLGLRATLEGFPTFTTGLVMTGYFAGFLAGSTIVPKLLRNVGHIRVFAALASLASISALLHPLFVAPASWIVLRLITGFCFAGLYVVAESWINDVATNETRGQLLGVYMVILLGGMGVGQLMLNIASPMGVELFILISVMVSVAVLPISLTVSNAPRFDAPEHIGMGALYNASPLGVVGALGIGTLHGGMFGMGAVYANAIGLPVSWVSYFMASILFGGMVLQWPIGKLSDHFDRRQVIIAVAAVAALSSLLAIVLGAQADLTLLTLMAILGGASLPLYSLFIAHTNDFLRQEQMVAGSATLVLVGGIGASMGPALCSLVMAVAGPDGYLAFIVFIHAALAVFAAYRTTQRKSKPVEAQLECAPVVSRTSPVAVAIAAETVRDHRDQDLARLIRY